MFFLTQAKFFLCVYEFIIFNKQILKDPIDSKLPDVTVYEQYIENIFSQKFYLLCY